MRILLPVLAFLWTGSFCCAQGVPIRPAQDVLKLKSGDVIRGLILEWNAGEVRYRQDNLPAHTFRAVPVVWLDSVLMRDGPKYGGPEGLRLGAQAFQQKQNPVPER